MADEIARRCPPPQDAKRRVDGVDQAPDHATSAAPRRRMGKPFTFSFSSGTHLIVRQTMETMDAILMRTLYRPFMRFMPLRVVHVSVPVTGLPSSLHGLKIAQISDIHHSQAVPLSIVEQAVAAVNGLQPDVVFLTGDVVTNDVSYAAAAARVLAALCAPLGVFAILGNHDHWTDPAEVTAQLRANGITVLVNEARQITEGLWVAGMDDIWSGQPDLEGTMAAVPGDATTILLAHEPDFADQAQGRGIALQLSGHSHGGQVRLPFTSRPVLPTLAWKYYSGLQCVGDMWVYTNGGLGTMLPPFIFTCRPEVALLRLVAA